MIYLNRYKLIVFLCCLLITTVWTSISFAIKTPDPDYQKYLRNVSLSFKKTNIDKTLQTYLQNKVNAAKSPIAAITVVDIEDASIIAMVEGRSAASWDYSGHTATYSGFPAASLFKTVSAVALIDHHGRKHSDYSTMTGGCQHVTGKATWLKDVKKTKHSRISLRRAYGVSCNRYFAKEAIQTIGFPTLHKYIKKLGWNVNTKIADIPVNNTQINIPDPDKVSTQNLGKFAAGFGKVGMSSLHAAWQMMTIMQDGKQAPLRFYNKSPRPIWNDLKPTLKKSTKKEFLKILNYSIRSGSADYVGRKRRFRSIRKNFGGKTGTLTGMHPFGLVTWFAGVYPLDKPRYAISSVVVLDDDLWFAKGPQLAAEAAMGLRKKQRLALKKR